MIAYNNRVSSLKIYILSPFNKYGVALWMKAVEVILILRIHLCRAETRKLLKKPW
jgi:hypothetical protein